MTKRFTALSFILIANIVLLAHVVLPHHHHDAEICMESQHCETEDSGHNHDQDDTEHKNHQHHGESETSNCVLDQDIPILTNKVKTGSQLSDISANTIYTTYISLNKLDLCNYKANRTNAPPPLIKQRYTEYAPGTFGLRAPPTV